MSDLTTVLDAAAEMARIGEEAGIEQGRWLLARHSDAGAVVSKLDAFAAATVAFVRGVIESDDVLPCREQLLKAAAHYIQWARNARSQYVENLGSTLNHMAGQAALDARRDADEAWSAAWAVAGMNLEPPHVAPRDEESSRRPIR